jgi:hypothetical protein
MQPTEMKINTFTITSQVYYDQYNQCYKNIMTVNIIPFGPIKALVRKIQFPKLSPFKQSTPCYPIQNCGFALTSLNGFENSYGDIKNSCGCNLMTPDEMPELISFLLANGYQIETQITNLLNQSQLKLTNKKIAFMVTYYGETQPNITYMR